MNEYAISRGVPRLAVISDLSGFGRCSVTVALPIISAMKVQVCPVPTSILSNHLGFPTYYFDDYTPHMREFLHGWEQLGLTFNGLYCGFLGSVEQIAIAEEMLNHVMLRDSLFLLDPVMGDHGEVYSTITPEHIDKMQTLLKYADILTPNITEACLLTGTPYKESGWTDQELTHICHKLTAACKPNCKIVITGIRNCTSFFNYIWENDSQSIYEIAVAGTSRPGTGDVFASVLAGDALNGVPFPASVKKAAEFTALCIQGTEEAGVPIQEGVLFEKYLYYLIND